MTEVNKSMGSVSDGYHTFDELYQHRSILFLALMQVFPLLSWYSLKHDDGTMFDDMFIVGMNLPTGQITYHLEIDPWLNVISLLDVCRVDQAPTYDGHTSEDVVERIIQWLIQIL